jgi:hypothetical protein
MAPRKEGGKRTKAAPSQCENQVNHMGVCAAGASDGLEALHREHAAATKASVEATTASNATLAVGTCDALKGEADLAVKACDDVMDLLGKSDATANASGERVASAVEESAEAVQQYYATMQTQMGHMRAHELRLRRDEPTGETPQKRDLTLPTALPAFRPDDEVIADFRRLGGVPGPLAVATLLAG